MTEYTDKNNKPDNSLLEPGKKWTWVAKQGKWK